ncbi:uncharacterized protein LOC111207884 [Brassica napus]|uniref:uncharacterized protein LOC111207884 n=1 Tax=Brassica napus TaxID=3708 RepID=UPI000BBEB511|nr:uncharacterized protein LOC111207884 [Brassica napus]
MASKTIAIILLFNIVFFTTANAACPSNDVLLKACGVVLKPRDNINLSESEFRESCGVVNDIESADVEACLCAANQNNPLNVTDISAAVTMTLTLCGLTVNVQCPK